MEMAINSDFMSWQQVRALISRVMQEFKLYSRRRMRRIKYIPMLNKMKDVLEIEKSVPNLSHSFMGDCQLCKRKTI